MYNTITNLKTKILPSPAVGWYEEVGLDLGEETAGVVLDQPVISQKISPENRLFHSRTNKLVSEQPPAQVYFSRSGAKGWDLVAHTCRNTRIWGSRLLVKICLTSPGGGFDVASKTFDVAWEHLTSPERLSTSSDRIYSLHSIPLIHYNYVLFLSYSL